MTAQQFLEEYYRETRRRMYGEKSPFSSLLVDRWIEIGQDEHAREIIDRIIGLPILVELFDGTYMLYDGGKYLMLMEDPNVAHGYFAIPRGMMYEGTTT
jgi:hypothetical protein